MHRRTRHPCFLPLYIAEDLANSYFLEHIPLLHTPPQAAGQTFHFSHGQEVKCLKVLSAMAI